MPHGVESFFQERARTARSVSLLTLGLNLGVLGLLLVLLVPAVHQRIAPAIRHIVRFGYEGPDRYVDRILLAMEHGNQVPLRDVGRVLATPSRRGGSGLKPAHLGVRPSSPRPHALPGPGEADEDRVAQARALRANVPLVQSSELVIDSMNQPDYPEALHSRGIEGRVALMALVDTTGRVAEVTVVGGTGEPEFEQSAMDAVWRARFRPYRVAGATQEVYALIRYRFRIY